MKKSTAFGCSACSCKGAAAAAAALPTESSLGQARIGRLAGVDAPTGSGGVGSVGADIFLRKEKKRKEQKEETTKRLQVIKPIKMIPALANDQDA